MAEKELNNFKRKVQFMGLKMETAAKKLGISKQTMYNYLNRAVVDPSFIESIKLVLGITLDDSSNNTYSQETYNADTVHSESVNYIKKSGIIYYVPVAAMAGFLNSNSDQIFLNNLHQIILPPEYKGVDFVFEVDGDSMYSTFSNGDHIGCRRITNQKYVRFGEPYVIDIGDGGLLLKRLMKSENDHYVILRSDNEGYQDIEVERSAWPLILRNDIQLYPR